MAVTETSTRAHAALDDLYRRHVGDVYRYTYAVLGNHADAEDVTQTTFVNALRALERGEEPQNPSNWLLVIAHNVVRQRWRQAAARPSEVELVHDVPDASTDDDVELDGLVRALQRIPPAQREALVMRELEGRSYREIAELLGLTTSALETLLFRARRSLAEELENIVTCQNAELAISRQLDDRLSRKDRRRLEEHLAECGDCSRLADAQRRQRRAFKGLALLPVPVGLAIFKGAPAASAATLPTIGLGASGAGGTAATGTVGAGGAIGAAGTGAASAGGAAVGGSLVGGAVAKVAAVVVAASVATGVGYEGVKAVRDTPAPARPAVTKPKPLPVAVPVAGMAVGEKTTKTAKKNGHASPAHGRKDTSATHAAKPKVVGLRHGRSDAAKTRTKPARTVRDKPTKLHATPAATRKQPKASKPPRVSKPKDAPRAARPPDDAPATGPKESQPSVSNPPASESPSSGSTPALVSAQPPEAQPPASQPPASAPVQPEPPAGAPGGGAGNGHQDNGNHNGWDNANKDEKAAAKAEPRS